MTGKLFHARPVPGKDHHEIPGRSVFDGGSKAHAQETHVSCLVGFARSRTNVSIISDHDPAAGGHHGNPVRVVLWYDLDRRGTASNDDISPQPHERDPESAEVLIYEKPRLVEARHALCHAIRRWRRK